MSVWSWFACLFLNSSSLCSKSCIFASVPPPKFSSGRSALSASPCVHGSLHVTAVTLPSSCTCGWDWAVGCVKATDSASEPTSSGRTSTHSNGLSSSSALRAAAMMLRQADLQSGFAPGRAISCAHWWTAANTSRALSQGKSAKGSADEWLSWRAQVCNVSSDPRKASEIKREIIPIPTFTDPLIVSIVSWYLLRMVLGKQVPPATRASSPVLHHQACFIWVRAKQCLDLLRNLPDPACAFKLISRLLIPMLRGKRPDGLELLHNPGWIGGNFARSWRKETLHEKWLHNSFVVWLSFDHIKWMAPNPPVFLFPTVSLFNCDAQFR